MDRLFVVVEVGAEVGGGVNCARSCWLRLRRECRLSCRSWQVEQRVWTFSVCLPHVQGLGVGVGMVIASL